MGLHLPKQASPAKIISYSGMKSILFVALRARSWYTGISLKPGPDLAVRIVVQFIARTLRGRPDRPEPTTQDEERP